MPLSKRLFRAKEYFSLHFLHTNVVPIPLLFLMFSKTLDDDDRYSDT